MPARTSRNAKPSIHCSSTPIGQSGRKTEECRKKTRENRLVVISIAGWLLLLAALRADQRVPVAESVDRAATALQGEDDLFNH